MNNEAFWTLAANVGIGVVFLVAGFLVGPAVGFVDRRTAPQADTLRFVREGAERVTRRPPRLARVVATQSSNSSDWDRVIVGAVAAALAVLLYMTYRVEILFVISIIALATSVAAIVSLLVMSRNSVIAGTRSLILTMLGILLSFAVGIVDVWLLWSPAVGGDTLDGFVRAFEDTGTFGSIEGAFFVAYPILGAGRYVVVAVFCIGFSIAVLSAINLHIRAWGAWFWRLAFRYTPGAWSKWGFGLSITFSVFSVLFVGGFIYEWLQAWQSSAMPGY